MIRIENKILLLSFIGFVVAGSAEAQVRFVSGDMKGFTRSPTEHIINELDEVIQVQRVEGIVVLAGEAEPIADVLFEIRGPGLSQSVKGVKTDQTGHFRLKHVASGSYRFKATLNGFQSVVGTIVVGKKGRSQPIRIQLRFGV